MPVFLVPSVFATFSRESKGIMKKTVSLDRNGDRLNDEEESIDLKADSAIDQARIRRAVREILLAVGETRTAKGFRKRRIESRGCTPKSSKGCGKIPRST